MGKKLLVADDSLTIQKVIKLALSGDVYDIQTVSDGNDALQQIAVFHPDAVLIDVGIPGRSAFEVKKAMNEDQDFRNIPVILMSSAFEKVDEAKVALLQFEGRLTKPFDPTHLRQALTQALSLRESYAPPAREESSLAFAKEPVSAKPPAPMPTPTQSKREATREIQREATRETKAPVKEPVREPTREIFVEEKTKTFNTLNTPLETILPPKTGTQIGIPTSKAPLEIDPPIQLQVPAPLSFPKEIEIPEIEPIALGMPEESDIRHLTESTVRMSSLDEYDSWNIGENAKNEPMVELNQPMTPSKIEMEDSFLESNKINFDYGDVEPKRDHSLEEIMPPKFDHSHTRSIQSIAPTRFDLEHAAPKPEESFEQPTSYSIPSPDSLSLNFPKFSGSGPLTSNPTQMNSAPAPTTAAAAPPSAEALAASMSASMSASLNSEEMQKKIEELVRAQVEKSLEMMAKKGLPDIAEKVIRQEIRRILESLN